MEEKFVEGFKEFLPEPTGLIVVDRRQGMSDLLGTASAARVTRDATWIRESGACLVFRHAGRELLRGSQYSDYYGFLASGRELIENFQETLADYGVTAESTLEVVVNMWLEDTPTLGFDHVDQFKRRQYRAIPGDAAIFLSEGIPESESFLDQPFEKKIALRGFRHSSVDVWSSVRRQDENEEAMASFRKFADAPPDARTVGQLCEA